MQKITIFCSNEQAKNIKLFISSNFSDVNLSTLILPEEVNDDPGIHSDFSPLTVQEAKNYIGKKVEWKDSDPYISFLPDVGILKEVIDIPEIRCHFRIQFNGTICLCVEQISLYKEMQYEFK